MGGKRQANVLSALITNFDTAEKAIEASANSSGSALRENEVYLDSIQGRIDLLTNAVQTMWQNTLDSDVIKWFVNLLTKIIQIIDKLGLIPSLLITISTISMVKNKMGPLAFFTELFNGLQKAPGKIKGFIKTFLGIESAADIAAKSIKGLTVGTFQQSLATAGVTETNQAALLSQMGLTEANASHVIGQQTLNAQTLAQAVNNGTLTSSQATLLAQTYGLTGALTTLTAQQMTQALTTNGVSAAQAAQIVTTLGLSTQSKMLSADQVTQALTSAGVSAAQAGQIVTALGLSAANKGLAASFKALWASMWPVLLVMGAIAAIIGVVKIFDAIHKSAEELKEEISDLKSELSDLESEIESLNDELETTQERIAELLAMPSLSFTEQEELANLQAQSAELERQIALKERLAKLAEQELIDTTDDYIEKAWNSGGRDKAYTINTITGVIQEDKWYTGGTDTKTSLDVAMNKYAKQREAKESAEEIYANWDKYSQKERNEALTNLKHSVGDYSIDLKASKKDYETYIKFVDDNMTDVAGGIAQVLNDEALSGLKYGMSDAIDAYLDEWNAYQYKWDQAMGIDSTSSAIASMFDDTASEEIKKLKEELSAITSDDNLDDTQKQTKATEILNNALNDNSGAYDRLKTSMDIIGISAKEIVNYFSQIGGAIDSSTVEGVAAQYAKGEEVLHRMMSSTNFEQDWGEFFTKDDEGVFKARADKFGEILKGMDNDARETFIGIVESAINGADDLNNIDWNNAISSFNVSGIIAATKVMEAQFDELNKSIFKDLDNEISGFIDTFSELSAALEDVSSSMDLLHTAQTQMNNSGRISIKTALELIESTDQWDKMLTITEDSITLNTNAEEVLIQTKLNTIKAQTEQALSAIELQLANLGSADSAYSVAIASDVSDEAYEQYTNAMNSYSASIAGFGAALDALLDGDSNTKVFDSFSQAYNTAKKIANSSADLSTVNRAELEQQRKDLQAQKNMLSQGGSVSGFKNYYDYDKTPGDKYNEGVSDKFKKAMDYWENRISANQAKYEQIQNEIDLLEAKGMRAGEEYYREQIELENERKSLLEQQKAEALRYLGTLKEGSDEWWEVANTINDIEGELDDVIANVQELNDAIGQIRWDGFEELHERFSNLTTDLENIRDILSNEDMFDDEGNWTEEGVATLATYLQEMEIYKNALADAQEELADFQQGYEGNEDYFASIGIDSEQEYYDKLVELTDEQDEYTKKIKESEQSVVEMYENQIDAVEEYIGELVDSYNDYIDVVKESLDAERD